MPYSNYIKELISSNSVLKINHIQGWLVKYEDEYRKAIGSTECRKWARYLMIGEKPFPCVCPTRVEDCIFIELYYELSNVLQIMLQDEVYKNALKPYDTIKHNKNAVFEWVKANENIGRFLSFKGKIQITLNNEPYKILEIALDNSECENVLKFKNIFSSNYYSKEYENY